MSNIERGYSITTDPNYLDKQNAMSPELSRSIERYYHMALDGKKSSIRKILDAIEQFPDTPQLKNYLSVLYEKLNNTQKVHEVTRWIVAEHPNYLFGKLNLANEYYLKEEYDKMPDILGREMEIKALYPDRDTFHLSEVMSFLICSVLYFTAIGDIEQAEIRHEMMHNLEPDSFKTETAMRHILIARLKVGQKRSEDSQNSRVSVETKPQEIKTISQSPIFYHQEIRWLYCNGLYIGEEKINILLSLPKDTLIQDLELVLQDSIDRYGYFYKLVDENGWEEEKMNFVVHSLFLLGELKVAKSIDIVIKVLSQSNEYLELYLGDFLGELIWEILYKIAADNLEVCKQFMFKPGIDTYGRTIFPGMVVQLALHHPERRDEAINWFNAVIQFFLTSNIEENVIDSDFIGLLICDLIDIRGSELLSEIKKLFDRGIVAENVCGDWKEVSEAFMRPERYSNKRKILSIAERYKNVTSTWAGYKQEKSKWKNNNENIVGPSIKQVLAKRKIGRNQPCPCGSGKKYKKCCLN